MQEVDALQALQAAAVPGVLTLRGYVRDENGVINVIGMDRLPSRTPMGILKKVQLSTRSPNYCYLTRFLIMLSEGVLSKSR